MIIYILVLHDYYESGYRILATGSDLDKINKRAEEHMTSVYWELDFEETRGSRIKGWSNRQTQELLTVEKHEIA